MKKNSLKPTENVLLLAQEILGLQQAHACLEEIVDMLGLEPDENGIMSFDTIITELGERLND